MCVCVCVCVSECNCCLQKSARFQWRNGHWRSHGVRWRLERRLSWAPFPLFSLKKSTFKIAKQTNNRDFSPITQLFLRLQKICFDWRVVIFGFLEAAKTLQTPSPFIFLWRRQWKRYRIYLHSKLNRCVVPQWKMSADPQKFAAWIRRSWKRPVVVQNYWAHVLSLLML